ncbi:MAG: hypothetical protein QOD99_809 [Chthoniobacter sp.]|jgi:hypothetical protein|nr:hypothetical protein [Chthoniobacter sp.]
MKPPLSVIVPLWIVAGCSLWMAWQITQTPTVKIAHDRQGNISSSNEGEPLDVHIVGTNSPVEVAIKSFDITEPLDVNMASSNPNAGFNVNIVGSARPLEVSVDDSTPIQVQTQALPAQ